MARLTIDLSVKFRLLVRRVGLAEPFVRGLLDTFWDSVHSVGNPVLRSPDEIEIASKWPGTPGEWFEALHDGGWVDETKDGRWLVHDYWDHAPNYVVARHAKRLNLKRPEFLTRARLEAEKLRKVTKNVMPTKPSLAKPIQAKTRPIEPSRADLPSAETADARAPSEAIVVAESMNGGPAKSARPRDELFDAVAEVGCADPKLDGKRIGCTCKALRSADPPYTPAEVRALPSSLHAHGLDFTLTVEAIAKHIGRVRAQPPDRLQKGRAPPNGDRGSVDSFAEKLRASGYGDAG